MPGESGCDTPLSEFNFPELPDYPSPVKLTEGIRRWEESDEEFSVPVVPTAGAILSEASEQGINDAVEDSSGMRQGSKAAQATSLPTGAAPSDDPPGKEFDADPELAQRIATVQRAALVAKSGTYLALMDLFLYLAQKGKDLAVCVFDKDDTNIVSFRSVIRDLLPEEVVDWEDCLDEEIDLSSEHTAVVVCFDEEHPEDHAMLMKSLQKESELLEAEAEFLQAMKSLDLVAYPVPSDGNCGPWTLASLCRPKPPLVSGEDIKQYELEPRKIRRRIRKLWTELSMDFTWQIMFNMFDLDEDLPIPGADQLNSVVKREPATPPKKKQTEPRLEVPPLATPPKAVAACRRAEFGQPLKKDGRLLAAGSRAAKLHREGDVPVPVADEQDSDKEDEEDTGAPPHRAQATQAQLPDITAEQPSAEADGRQSLLLRNRMAPCKKAYTCPNGGYLKVQARLLDVGAHGDGCKACDEMILNSGFDRTKFDAVLQAAENGELPQPIQGATEPIQGVTETANEDEQKAVKEEDLETEKPEGLVENGDPFDIVRQTPYIKLLPPGSHGKRFPYLCTVCCTRSWPQGRVGELAEAKIGSIKHFLHQHIDSNTHKRNVKRKETGGQEIVAPPTQECQGVSLDDARSARHLHYMQGEFDLWCSMANLKDTARHKY
ncbi:unnamed protein product [Durusdinium trenchii]|uniref:Uncharacterized protein n=1 Tax=Durusdinium trenchii TaxID=1381693 RepID=A0ABP0KZM2_9DINO